MQTPHVLLHINGPVCKYMPCMSDSQRESNKDFQDYDTSANNTKSYVTNRHQLDDDGTMKGNDIHHNCSDYFTKYCEIGALPSKEENIVATWIYKNIFCR